MKLTNVAKKVAYTLCKAVDYVLRMVKMWQNENC